MTDTLTPEEFLRIAMENERLEAIVSRQAEEILKLVARAERAESTARDAVAQSGRHIQNRIGLESTIRRQDAQMKRQQEELYRLKGDRIFIEETKRAVTIAGTSIREVAKLAGVQASPSVLRSYATMIEEDEF